MQVKVTSGYASLGSLSPLLIKPCLGQTSPDRKNFTQAMHMEATFY